METSWVPTRLTEIAVRDNETLLYNVVVETPRGSRNRYTYDEDLGVFRLDRVVPSTSAFKVDFGFLPSTSNTQGVPIPALVLMDEPVFPGCLVPSRLLGVVEGVYTHNEEEIRTPFLIMAADSGHSYHQIQSLDQLNEQSVQQLMMFVALYTDAGGHPLKPAGSLGPEDGRVLVEEGMKQYGLRTKVVKRTAALHSERRR